MPHDTVKPTEVGNTRDYVPAQDLLKRAAQNGFPPLPADEGTAIRNVIFWKDGFQFDNGELRRYTDPVQAQILNELNAGRAPPSALNVRPGQRVELRVVKRIEEDYVPPKDNKAVEG